MRNEGGVRSKRRREGRMSGMEGKTNLINHIS